MNQFKLCSSLRYITFLAGVETSFPILSHFCTLSTTTYELLGWSKSSLDERSSLEQLEARDENLVACVAQYAVAVEGAAKVEGMTDSALTTDFPLVPLFGSDSISSIGDIFERGVAFLLRLQDFKVAGRFEILDDDEQSKFTYPVAILGLIILRV